MAKKSKIYILIPAAGSGSRMHSKTNKQFLEIDGLPVIIRSLQILDRLEEVTALRLIVAAPDLAAMEELLARYSFQHPIAISLGGKSRQESVYRGLQDLAAQDQPQDDDLVLVHDGARCLVTSQVVRDCLAGIRTNNCACAAAVALKDTIKIIEPGLEGPADYPLVKETPNRNLLRAVQTPQGHYFGKIMTAYRWAADGQTIYSDDLSLMEAAGQKVRLSKGDYKNIKITTPEDLILAASLIADDVQACEP